MKIVAKLFILCVCLAGLFLGLAACVEKKTVDIDLSSPASSTPSTPATASDATSTSTASSTASSSAPAALGPSFQWLGYTVRITLDSDDQEEVGTITRSAAGRYVGVRLAPEGEGFLYDTISDAYSSVTLQDKSGNSYTPTSMSLTLPEGANFRDLSGVILPDVTLVYDIPPEVPRDALSMYIPDGDTITLADYM